MAFWYRLLSRLSAWQRNGDLVKHDGLRFVGQVTATSPNGSELIHLWEIRLHDYGSIVAVHHIIFIIRDILVDRSV